VPLEQPDLQHWQAASGYAELGMFLEADTELDKIDPFNRAAPEVLATRLAIYRGLEKWELMLEIAKRLADFQPNDIQWTISIAYAIRRANSIQAAKEVLLNAESKFPKEAAIKYNLACYFCQTGDIQKARDYLQKVFEIDLNWRMAALEDEDLKVLWESL
jgi:tetratricopeptide (TPR) repeat protein